MAKVSDVRLSYRFKVTITSPDGTVWNELECEKVEFPTKKITTTTVGAGDHLSKIPGMEELDNLKISKIRSSGESDKKSFDWYKLVKGKGNRAEYARTITVQELDADLVKTLNTHVFTEAFPVSIKMSPFDRTEAAGKVMEELEFSVDEYDIE